MIAAMGITALLLAVLMGLITLLVGVGYDTIIWAEATQNNGMAGVAGLAGQAPYSASGDTLKTPKKLSVVGLAGTSLTKPNGCRIAGNLSRAANYFYGPAALNPATEKLRDIQLEFQDGELITAQMSNTNVSEESQVHADVVWDAPHPWARTIWEMMRAIGGKALHIVQCTITVATTKTAFNGEVALDAACTETTGWLNKDKRYAILGIVQSLSTTAFGVVMFRSIDKWQGRFPGVAVNKLDGTFEAKGVFSPCYEPIPFEGNKLPSISEVGLVAAAGTFGLVIAEL